MLEEVEPIVRHVGHDLVTASGRKMSKHLGNAVSPDEILQASGGDALRVAVLWAPGPQRPLEWRPSLLPRAEAFLDAVYWIYARVPARVPVTEGTHALRARIARAGQMIDAYRPNAALEELWLAMPKLDGVVRRLESGRSQTGDGHALCDYLQALAPFAPHLADELWHRLGEAPFVFQRTLAVWGT